VSADAYQPTPEQDAIIRHDGHAFIRACPGGGKTRTMVERARRLLTDRQDRRGVAFLSFTNAAVEELEARLRSFCILPSPLFPSFIGTFDRFLWQFFIVPFGVIGCHIVPRLVPDKSDWEVKPFGTAQPLKLKHFDRLTGTLLSEKAAEVRFNPKFGPKAWETIAQNLINRALADGRLDFEDVRECVRNRLAEKLFSDRLGAALAGRFREIVVDEAQDCNPADLEIVKWLRSSGIKIKVVCDPDQAIYAFRGGLTDELLKFGAAFDAVDRLTMSGNFRSSPSICATISQLRPPTARGAPDVPLGPYKDETTPVYIMAYGGTGVPVTIGKRFQALAARFGIPPASAPVLASTWASAGRAVGRAVADAGNDKTLILAEAVTAFHFAFEAGNRREALAHLHRAILLVRGEISNLGAYSNYVTMSGLEDGRWRPTIIDIGQRLYLRSGEQPDQWLQRARDVLNSDLVGSSTINQRLRAHAKLGSIMAEASPMALPARAIHAVKGLEFPAICVVLTAKTTGGILDVLTGATVDAKLVEDTRKIYVAASRAERLLTIAAPKNRASALKAVLDAGGHPVQILDL
jgi:hypothetical protein